MKIVDKIVTILLSICTGPIVIFTPIVRIVYQITAWGLLEKFSGMQSTLQNDQGYTMDSYSLWWAYKNLLGGSLSVDKIDMSKVPDNIKAILPFVFVAGILFAVAALIGIVMIFVTAFTRAKKTQCVICGVGIIDLIVCGIFFSKFASPIISGTVSIGNILTAIFGDKINAVISVAATSIVKVNELALTGAFALLIFIFALIIIWNVSFMLTSDNKKAEKK